MAYFKVQSEYFPGNIQENPLTLFMMAVLWFVLFNDVVLARTT